MQGDEPLIVLADDDPDDRMLIFDALQEVGIGHLLETVADGCELLERLRSSARRRGPTIVVLDLNMPRLGGRETVATIRNDPKLRHTPVVVLTTSASADEVAELYALGVNSFITKPSSFGQMVAIFSSLQQYWLGTVQLPLST